MRDSTPADIAIRCALETGASLRWLVTGEGAMFDHLSATQSVFLLIELMVLI